jgi:hypothetical protein
MIERLADYQWLAEAQNTGPEVAYKAALRALLAALAEATEQVMAQERPIQAALINQRDDLQRRLDVAEAVARFCDKERVEQLQRQVEGLEKAVIGLGGNPTLLTATEAALRGGALGPSA